MRITTRFRIVLILPFVLFGAILVLWRLLLPDAPAPVPGTLTERDKREIAQMCRRYTLRFAVDKLRHGDFGWFTHSVRVLFQQRINRFIDDHDGTYRIYVVVYAPNQPDGSGFYAWSRHQVARTNGQWTILRSY